MQSARALIARVVKGRARLPRCFLENRFPGRKWARMISPGTFRTKDNSLVIRASYLKEAWTGTRHQPLSAQISARNLFARIL